MSYFYRPYGWKEKKNTHESFFSSSGTFGEEAREADKKKRKEEKERLEAELLARREKIAEEQANAEMKAEADRKAAEQEAKVKAGEGYHSLGEHLGDIFFSPNSPQDKAKRKAQGRSEEYVGAPNLDKFTGASLGVANVAGGIALGTGEAMDKTFMKPYMFAPAGAVGAATADWTKGKGFNYRDEYKKQMAMESAPSDMAKLSDKYIGTELQAAVDSANKNPVEPLVTTALLAGAVASGGLIAGAVAGGLSIYYGSKFLYNAPKAIKAINDEPDAKRKFALFSEFLTQGMMIALGGKEAFKVGHNVYTDVTGKSPIGKNGQPKYGGKYETTKVGKVDVPYKDAEDFFNFRNPDITPEAATLLQEAMLKNHDKFVAEMKVAHKLSKETGGDIHFTVEAVPTVYGKLLDIIKNKMDKGEPLTPEEGAVVNEVVNHPNQFVKTRDMVPYEGEPDVVVPEPTTVMDVKPPESGPSEVPGANVKEPIIEEGKPIEELKPEEVKPTEEVKPEEVTKTEETAVTEAERERILQKYETSTDTPTTDGLAKYLRTSEQPVTKAQVEQIIKEYKTPDERTITTYSGHGGEGTPWSSTSEEFAKEFASEYEDKAIVDRHNISVSDILDTRNEAHLELLQKYMRKGALEEMMQQDGSGLPNHDVEYTIGPLIESAKKTGFDYLAVSENETKFGTDLVSYVSLKERPTSVSSGISVGEINRMTKDQLINLADYNNVVIKRGGSKQDIKIQLSLHKGPLTEPKAIKIKGRPKSLKKPKNINTTDRDAIIKHYEESHENLSKKGLETFLETNVHLDGYNYSPDQWSHGLTETQMEALVDTYTPKKPTQKEQVKKVTKGRPKSIKQVSKETGIKEPNVRRILGVGAKEGTFARVEKGVYVLKVKGQDMAYIETANAVEALPRLASEGFKADMIFLDIPYETNAVKGGNRGVKYDFLKPQQFKSVLESLKTIARDNNTPVFYMYSQATTGLKQMEVYNSMFAEEFMPVARGEYQKTYKNGKPVAFPTSKGSMVTRPEGLIVGSISGKLDFSAPNLNFKLIRPKGYHTEKPAEMLKALIDMSTKEGDVVLDPFAGSGVTGAEAIKANRKSYNIEKNADVVEKVTKPRIEKAAEGTVQDELDVATQNLSTMKDQEKALKSKLDEIESGIKTSQGDAFGSLPDYTEGQRLKAEKPKVEKQLRSIQKQIKAGEETVRKAGIASAVARIENDTKKLLAVTKGGTDYTDEQSEQFSQLSGDYERITGKNFFNVFERLRKSIDVDTQDTKETGNPLGTDVVSKLETKYPKLYKEVTEPFDGAAKGFINTPSYKEFRAWADKNGYKSVDNATLKEIHKELDEYGWDVPSKYYTPNTDLSAELHQTTTDIRKTMEDSLMAPSLEGGGDGPVVKVKSFGEEGFVPLLEKYKGMDIVKTGKNISVWNPKEETLFVVALDDSKATGKRLIDEGANTIENAKKYIDWLAEKPSIEPPKTEGLAKLDVHAKYDYGKTADKITTPQRIKIMKDYGKTVKGGMELASKFGRPAKGYSVDSSREALVWGGMLNHVFTDSYTAIVNPTVADEINRAIAEKEIKAEIKAFTKVQEDGSSLSYAEAEKAARERALKQQEEQKDRFPKMTNNDNAFKLDRPYGAEAHVVGYYSSGTIVSAVLSDGETDVIVDADRLAFMDKHFPDATLRIGGEVDPVQFITNGKIDGVLMPLKQRNGGYKIPSELKSTKDKTEVKANYSGSTGTRVQTKLTDKEKMAQSAKNKPKSKSEVDKIIDLLAKPTNFHGGLADELYTLRTTASADEILATQKIAEILDKYTPEDQEMAYAYAEDGSIEVTDAQKELYDTAIRPFQQATENARAELMERMPETVQPGWGIHRIAKDRNSSIDRVAKGKTKQMYTGGKLNKTADSDKSRVMMGIEDKNGNVTVVSIKNKNKGKVVKGVKAKTGEKRVTAWKNGTGTDLGPLKAKLKPQATEFVDPVLMKELESIATNLGIKHIRTNKPFSRGDRAAGVSYTGAKTIKTRVGSAPDTLLHEIGHQIDEKYDVYNKMVEPAPMEEYTYKRGERKGETVMRTAVQPKDVTEARQTIKKEMRILADKRIGATDNKTFSKYIRSAPEKVAVMFQAYLHDPSQFREAAPHLYDKFEKFLRSNDDTKAITDIKKSFQMAKNIVGETRAGDEFISSAGEKYKIVNVTTRQIEANTGVEYYHNAVVNSVYDFLQVNKAVRVQELIHNLKNDPDWETIAAPSDAEGIPADWKTTSAIQFKGYKFDPLVAETLDDFAGMVSRDPLVQGYAINKFLRNAIFFNPLMHVPNIGYHWLMYHGASSMANPVAWWDIGKSGVTAINQVHQKGALYQEMLRHGAPLLSWGQQEMTEAIMDIMGDEIAKPEVSGPLAKALGVPRSAIAGIYKTSRKVTWFANDAFTMEAIISEMENGHSMDDAITIVGNHIPNYRLPARFLNNRALKQILGNPNVTMFMPYHYGILKSYTSVAKEFAYGDDGTPGKGPGGAKNWKEKAKVRAKAMDKMAAFAVMALVIYPILDEIFKKLTNNPNAHLRRAGPFTIPDAIAKAVIGERSWTSVATGVITPAPLLKAGVELMLNRDYFGNNIADMNDMLHDPVQYGKDIASYLANLVSPISVIRRAAGSTNNGWAKAGWGLLGVSEPSYNHLDHAVQNEYGKQFGGNGGMTQAEVRKYKARNDARRQIQENGDESKAKQLIEDGYLSERGYDDFVEEATWTSTQRAFDNLWSPAKLKILKETKYEDRDQLMYDQHALMVRLSNTAREKSTATDKNKQAAADIIEFLGGDKTLLYEEYKYEHKR